MNEYNIFNDVIDILHNKNHLYPVNNDYLQKDKNKDDLDMFLNNYVYNNLNVENIKDINNYIYISNNLDKSIYGVFKKNNKITTVVPNVKNIDSLLINTHELTHLINLLYSNNKAFYTIYSEIVPIFNEYFYLFLNNEDTVSFINNLLNNCINFLKIKKINEINQFAHIYATVLLNYLKHEDPFDYFNLFNDININSNSFSYDLKKNDLILSKKMLKNL